MKTIRYLQHLLRGHDKREIFLWGFYVSFLIVMTLAMILDWHIGNTVDAWIELVMVLLTLASIAVYRYTGNTQLAIYSIVALSTLTTYTYIFSNEYTVSIYHAIVPLGYFLLFSLRTALIWTAVHETIVLILYAINYQLHPDYLVYHHPVISVASALASLMIVLFGVVYHLAIENSYRLLAQSNRQKELLLKEVHHRVKNNLNIISSMLGLQMLREEDPRIRHIFEKNKYRIKSIALVHEILYRHSDFERIDVHEYLGQLADTLLGVYDRDVEVTIDGEARPMPFEQVLRIGIIANEMIVNSIKYGFDGTADAAIHMIFEEEESFYRFTYHDSNTRPVDTATLREGRSLGVRLIEMMVQQMDAQIDLNGQTGLHYTLRIPKDVH